MLFSLPARVKKNEDFEINSRGNMNPTVISVVFIADASCGSGKTKDKLIDQNSCIHFIGQINTAR